MVFSLNRLIPRDAMADREGSAPETRWRRVLGATALLFHSREHNLGSRSDLLGASLQKAGRNYFSKESILRRPARPGERECSSGRPPEVGVP
jgi:hypothetical protein